jgi:hypothetical protein
VPQCRASAHDQADRDAGDHAVSVGASGRGSGEGGSGVNRPRSALHAGADFFKESQPKGFANVQGVLGGNQIGGAFMCDYSLHAVATRPAEVAETLVSTNFYTGTRGFASPDNPHVAVCLRPGTEIAFEKDAQSDGMMFRKSIGDRLARFRQIDTDKPYQHHDALEFSNGAILLVTDLAAGQRATVLQLPASQIEEKPQASQPAARHENATV